MVQSCPIIQIGRAIIHDAKLMRAALSLKCFLFFKIHLIYEYFI